MFWQSYAIYVFFGAGVIILTSILTYLRFKGLKPDLAINGLALIPLVIGVPALINEVQTIRTLNTNFERLNSSFNANRAVEAARVDASLAFITTARAMEQMFFICSHARSGNPSISVEASIFQPDVMRFADSDPRTRDRRDCGVIDNIRDASFAYAIAPDLAADHLASRDVQRVIDAIDQLQFLLEGMRDHGLFDGGPLDANRLRHSLGTIAGSEGLRDPHLSQVEDMEFWWVYLLVFAVVLEISKYGSTIIFRMLRPQRSGLS